MIDLMADLPNGVIGFSAKGTVTAGDYRRVVSPAIETALSNRDKVRVLYVLGEEFRNFEAGAIWQDAKVGLEHLPAWERVGVVTDVEWIRHAVRAFMFLLGGSARLFHNDEIGAAREWIAG